MVTRPFSLFLGSLKRLNFFTHQTCYCSAQMNDHGYLFNLYVTILHGLPIKLGILNTDSNVFKYRESYSHPVQQQVFLDHSDCLSLSVLYFQVQLHWKISNIIFLSLQPLLQRWQRRNCFFPVFYGVCSCLSFWSYFQESFRVGASYVFLSWYPFKPNESFSLPPFAPFARLISIIWLPDVLYCCSSCSRAVLFSRLQSWGGNCSSTGCITRSVLHFCVGAGRLAGGGGVGVKSLVPRERW